MNLAALLLTLFSACSRNEEPARLPTTAELQQKVLLKVSLYESLIPSERQDSDGFLFKEGCDSTLYSGLLGAALPGTVNLLTARAPNGSWRRRSLTELPDCYLITKAEKQKLGVGGSKSSTSRDMATGQLWWMWRNKQLQPAVEMMEYARSHDYIMGEGDPARIALMPNLTKLLADIIYELSDGKKNYQAERYLPTVLATGLTDYEAHIQVWQILLDAEVNGGLRDLPGNRAADVLIEQYARRPDNPLYAAAWGKWISGDMNPAYQAMNNPRWPTDRLPDHSNYCTSWWMTSDNPLSINPCQSAEQAAAGHSLPSGAELVVVYHLVMESR